MNLKRSILCSLAAMACVAALTLMISTPTTDIGLRSTALTSPASDDGTLASIMAADAVIVPAPDESRSSGLTEKTDVAPTMTAALLPAPAPLGGASLPTVDAVGASALI